jgi:hypothetical protein
VRAPREGRGGEVTDRVQALTVALDHDMHEDDVQALVNAIACMRNVIAVGLNVVDPDAYVGRERAKQNLYNVVLGVMKE